MNHSIPLVINNITTRKNLQLFFYFFLLLFFCNIRSYYCDTQIEYLQSSIVMDGKNITEAFDEDNAIKINPNTGVIVRLEYLITGNQSIKIERLETVFIIADIKAHSQTDQIDINLSEIIIHNDNY